MSFRSIQTLTLKKCRNLQDISPLRGVYDLSLMQCWAITDLSSLGGHHRLEITWCSQILSGYHALKDIPIVKLVGCNISDVSVLSNSKILYLEGCGSLVDVSSFRGVRDLTLRDCTKIEDISMLTTVQKLTLYNLPELKSYEGVNEIPNLYLQISDLNDGMLLRFPNVKNIESSFFLLRDMLPLLPFLTNLHSLTIRYVSPVIIEVCIDIHTVILEKCDIKNIRGLGKNRVVRLFECRGDGIDVTCLATVPLVSIINCRFKNVNYERLLNVPRLKIEDWVDDR